MAAVNRKEKRLMKDLNKNEIKYVEDRIRFPEGMRFVFAPDDDMGQTFERDALLLYPYVVQGILSTGRVAEIIGTDRLSVIDFYESKRLPWLLYTEHDLEDDMATMRRLGLLKEGSANA